MFCTNCGATNPDNVKTCKSCGNALDNPFQASRGPGAGDVVPGQKPPNNLAFAIVVTLCCCLPFGIPAIVYAAQVDGKWSGGDYAGAVASSNSAKMWCWISLALGLVGMVVYMGLGVIGALAEKGNFGP